MSQKLLFPFFTLYPVLLISYCVCVIVVSVTMTKTDDNHTSKSHKNSNLLISKFSQLENLIIGNF